MDEEHREVVRFSTFLMVYGRLEREGAHVSIVGTTFQRLDDHEVEEGSERLVYHSHDFR